MATLQATRLELEETPETITMGAVMHGGSESYIITMKVLHHVAAAVCAAKCVRRSSLPRPTSGSTNLTSVVQARSQKFGESQPMPFSLAPATLAMAATKEKNSAKGVKREILNGDSSSHSSVPERPAKKAKLLDHTDDEGSDEEEGTISLKVNEEFARRFEHNKKREEKQRRMCWRHRLCVIRC